MILFVNTNLGVLFITRDEETGQVILRVYVNDIEWIEASTGNLRYWNGSAWVFPVELHRQEPVGTWEKIFDRAARLASRNIVDGGSPLSLPTDVIDGGSPQTAATGGVTIIDGGSAFDN
jgi:hypothetical protein